MNTNLHFTSRNTLEPCCSANIGPAFVEKLSEKESIKSFVKTKKKYIEMLKHGEIPKGCTDCVHLQDYQPVSDLRINKITLNHYTQCNCACIYCTQANRTLEKIKEDMNKPVLFDVLKFINELYDNDLIDTEKLYIDFQGGNISCLKNHEEIIDTFMKRGVGTIYIPTNNIVYMPLIENLLKMKKGEVCTALDAGCRETYLKIKQVDKFDKSVENLKRYITATGNDAVIVKYIIVNGYNDNLDEMKLFTDKMLEIGVRTIVVDIDYRDIIDGPFTIPKHYYDLVHHAENVCRENNMVFDIPPYTRSVLEKGFSSK
ncbi:MAG: radical SAM protein [Candidatus Gastranaerophilales bacterium]|nr:radical SAM protein [Candidatus Gastranaerophilales bacterium]